MIKRTPLYERHKISGAKFTEFSGWEMPVQYASIVQEHLSVRNAAGVFDISHMGQIFVEGSGSLNFLQKICTNDFSKCASGQALYSHLCNEKGGIIDDIFVYCLSQNEYLIVVNAATAEKDFNWMSSHKIPSAKIENRSAQLGMIALQGPKSEKVALKIFPSVPRRHQIQSEKFENGTIFICRTGYTGEDGFEIVAANNQIPKLWDLILEAGKEFLILPCGLGARDTLRLEMGYLLYGQDANEEHTPLEAGLPWVVKFSKSAFIGKEALMRQQATGLKRRLSGFKLLERGIPRHGSKIFCADKEVGTVTSGTFSPSLQIGIALGYVPLNLNGDFSIECHAKMVPAASAKCPFYNMQIKS